MVWSVYEFTDMCTGISSIFALALFPLERMYTLGWPQRRTGTFRVYILTIAVHIDPDINIHYYKVTALPLSIITPESFMYTRLVS